MTTLEPPTQPYWLADLTDPAGLDHGEGDQPRGLLADIADWLHADAIVIAVCAGMVLAVLSMAAGSWLFHVAEPVLLGGAR